DACQSGTCTGSSVTCTAQDQCHIAGSCDPSTGACSNPPKSNGSACDDGNSCTSGGNCQSGACTPGSPSCTNIAVAEGRGDQSGVPQLGVTLSTDVAAPVPGDIVNFTAQVTNIGTQFNIIDGQFSITNNGSQPFVVKGYQQTLEYFSISQGTWVPFAKLAY